MASETRPEAPGDAGQARSDLFVPAPIQMRDLIDAGLHFGHQTRRWNPKMRTYIYGVRNGVHIVDLQQTIRLFRRSYNFIVETVSRGGTVLFIGTKRQAQDVISREAGRCHMPFIVNRWIGGLLTNFRTVSSSMARLKELGARFGEEGGFGELKKKEVLRLSKERDRLEKSFGGLKDLRQAPAVAFVVDPGFEATAVKEAGRMNIPIVALIDTNCNPDLVDYLIPGNDDAIKSIQYVTARIADACLEGANKRTEVMGRSAADRDLVSPSAASSGGGPTVEYAQRKG